MDERAAVFVDALTVVLALVALAVLATGRVDSASLVLADALVGRADPFL